MSKDPVADNKAFREKFDFPYDLLSDEDLSLSQSFGVADADAKYTPRVSVLIGPDGKVAEVYNEVSPADHPSEVIATLDALG